MAPTLPDPELLEVLEQVTTAQISIKDANRRIGWMETGEARTCDTCRRFRDGICHMPGQPPRSEHPKSVRCVDHYVFDDPRDYAMLNEAKPKGSRMFK